MSHNRSQIRGLHSGRYGYKAITDAIYLVFQKDDICIFHHSRNGWEVSLACAIDDIQHFFDPEPGTPYETIDDSEALELFNGNYRREDFEAAG